MGSFFSRDTIQRNQSMQGVPATGRQPSPLSHRPVFIRLCRCCFVFAIVADHVSPPSVAFADLNEEFTFFPPPLSWAASQRQRERENERQSLPSFSVMAQFQTGPGHGTGLVRGSLLRGAAEAHFEPREPMKPPGTSKTKSPVQEFEPVQNSPVDLPAKLSRPHH